MKYLCLSLLVLALLNGTHGSLFTKKRCPQVNPVQGFDNNKLFGTWYAFMVKASTLGGDLNITCAKTSFNNDGNNNLIQKDEWTNGLGKRENLEMSFRLNASRPGLVQTQTMLPYNDMLGRTRERNTTVNWYVVHNDDNLRLIYTCVEIPNFWYSDTFTLFAILKKDRSFDSLSKVMPVINKLAALGVDMNDVAYIRNDQTCTN